MEPQNIVKGRIFEGTVTALFRRARYVTVPLGVETLFPDIDAFTVKEHLDQLPEPLRLLPDLMVYRWDEGNVKVHFVEVKYRSSRSDRSMSHLISSLESQFHFWPDTLCIVGLGSESNGSDYHQNYIRVVDKAAVDAHSEGQDYNLRSIDDVFPEFSTFGKKNPLVVNGKEPFEYARKLEDVLDNSVHLLKALAQMQVGHEE
jgi:hypothetical protein